MRDEEIIKANDILDKLDFFDGQRAGRELWFEKPFDVQNEDIEDFSKDIAFLRGFIADQQAEIEELEKYKHDYHVLKSEARKEFAERLLERAEKTTWISGGELVVKDYKISRVELDNLLAEKESEGQ